MEPSSLSAFLFELASDQRLGILTAVAERPKRHAQIARRLKMTDSETTRHLNRLASASLVSKNPRGEYEATNLTRLLMAGFPFLRFLVMQREFILNHDLMVLPSEFLERLGGLNEGSLVEGTYKVVAVQDQALRKVKRRIWVLSEQAFEQAIPILQDKSSDGADVRVIRPRDLFEEPIPSLPGLVRNYPIRVLEKSEVFLAVLDDSAGICFPRLDGKVDMSTMLLLEETQGYHWAADLFQHFWDQAVEPL